MRLLAEFFQAELDEKFSTLLSSALCEWNYENWDGSLHHIFILIETVFDFHQKFSLDFEVDFDMFMALMFSTKFELLIQRMVVFWNFHFKHGLSWEILSGKNIYGAISGAIITTEWLQSFVLEFGFEDFALALPDFRPES